MKTEGIALWHWGAQGDVQEKSFYDCEEYEEIVVFELEMDDIRGI